MWWLVYGEHCMTCYVWSMVFHVWCLAYSVKRKWNYNLVMMVIVKVIIVMVTKIMMVMMIVMVM